MTDEILSLQDKMKCLEKENQYLKSLLDRAGISYYASDEMKNRDLFDGFHTLKSIKIEEVQRVFQKDFLKENMVISVVK